MLILTKRKYKLLDVASALQKSIRRGDARLAGYWGIELFESGYVAYLWRRLLTISAEDCWGIITKEVTSLFDAWEVINSHKKGGGRVFCSKAIILLCEAKKSRDADHLTNLLYDPAAIPEDELERSLEEAREGQEEIPDYAFDCHTGVGRKRGKTRTDFFVSEHDALNPRQPGLFDGLVEDLRKKKDEG